jgi:hypothetical protein
LTQMNTDKLMGEKSGPRGRHTASWWFRWPVFDPSVLLCVNLWLPIFGCHILPPNSPFRHSVSRICSLKFAYVRFFKALGLPCQTKASRAKSGCIKPVCEKCQSHQNCIRHTASQSVAAILRKAWKCSSCQNAVQTGQGG